MYVCMCVCVYVCSSRMWVRSRFLNAHACKALDVYVAPPTKSMSARAVAAKRLERELQRKFR